MKRGIAPPFLLLNDDDHQRMDVLKFSGNGLPPSISFSPVKFRAGFICVE